MWEARGSTSALRRLPLPLAPYECGRSGSATYGSTPGIAWIGSDIRGLLSALQFDFSPTCGSSSRVGRAKYKPDTASSGGVHVADTSQFPQSYSSVASSDSHGGCACGSCAEGSTVSTKRAPAPPYQPRRYMSILYWTDKVLILNRSFSAGSTDMSDAKPCIDSSPAPLTSQTADGTPSKQFFQYMQCIWGGDASAGRVGKFKERRQRALYVVASNHRHGKCSRV